MTPVLTLTTAPNRTRTTPAEGSGSPDPARLCSCSQWNALVNLTLQSEGQKIQNTHFIKYEYYKSMLSIKIGLIKAQTCATIESNPSTAMKAATLSDEKPIICTKKTHKQFFI